MPLETWEVGPENPSTTVLEATAVGLPVIVVPEYDETCNMLLENEVAIGFARAHPESLSQSISKLASDATLRKRVSTNACRLIEKEMSWKRLAEKTLDIYNSATVTRHNRRSF